MIKHLGACCRNGFRLRSFLRRHGRRREPWSGTAAYAARRRLRPRALAGHRPQTSGALAYAPPRAPAAYRALGAIIRSAQVGAAYSFKRLCVRLIRDHSPRTFLIPRSRKRRNPRASFICPNTGSTIALRRA
jgi:hypothetical protein